MWRRTFGIPAPPAWPVAVAFTLSLAVAAARADDPRRLTPDICLALLAATSVVCSARAGRVAAVAVAGVAWLFDNGFVLNQAGDLRWHTASDASALALLVGCALASSFVTSAFVTGHLHRPDLSTTPQNTPRPLERTHG